MSSPNTASESPIILPVVTIQPSFTQVISEVESGLIPSENFWISCYRQFSPSVHAKIQVRLDEINRDLVHLNTVEGDAQIQAMRFEKETRYTVSCPSLQISETSILLPRREYSDPERSNGTTPQRIVAFDVSPDGSQFATGFHDGSIHLYPTNPAKQALPSFKQVAKKAHLSSVTALKFFPSSRVLLSAGNDFSLSILPAEPFDIDAHPTAGSPTFVSAVRTIRGHTRPITSTAIVSRGRNIVSGSTDGTVRLWDVGSGQQIHAFVAGDGKHVPVTAVVLSSRREEMRMGDIGFSDLDGNGDGSDTTPTPDAREVDTSDKILYCALQNGSFEILDLRSKRGVYASGSNPDSLSAIARSERHRLLATGSTRGIVAVFDERSLKTRLTSFRRNSGSVHDLAFLVENNFLPDSNPRLGESVGLVVAGASGLPFVASVRPEGPSVSGELVGGDCDEVRFVRVMDDGCVWTAADDGVVRRY